MEFAMTRQTFQKQKHFWTILCHFEGSSPKLWAECWCLTREPSAWQPLSWKPCRTSPGVPGGGKNWEVAQARTSQHQPRHRISLPDGALLLLLFNPLPGPRKILALGFGAFTPLGICLLEYIVITGPQNSYSSHFWVGGVKIKDFFFIICDLACKELTLLKCNRAPRLPFLAVMVYSHIINFRKIRFIGLPK